MADQNIRINVGTSFKGEGLVKAERGVRSLGQATSKVGNGLKIAQSELVKMDGTLGKVAQSIGGVSNAFASMGIAGAVIAGFQVAMDAYFTWQKKKLDAMVERAKKAQTEVEKALKNIIKTTREHMSLMNDHTDKALKNADAVTKQAEAYAKLSGAIDKTTQAQQSMAGAQTRLDNFNKNKGFSGWDRKFAESDDRVNEARTGIDNAIRNGGDMKSSAFNKVLNLQQRQEADNIALQQASIALSFAKDKLDRAKVIKSQDISEIKGEYKTAQQNYKKAMDNLEKTIQDLTVAKEEKNATDIKADEMVINAKRELAEALDARAKAQEEYERQERSVQRQSDIIRGIVEEGKLRDRILAIDKKIEQAKRNILNGERSRERAQFGMDYDNSVHGGISGRGYRYSTDENGNINRFDQFRRAQRYARNAANGGGGGGGGGRGDGDNTYNANAQKAIRLQARENSGKKLSKQDRQWLDDWEAFNEQNRVAEDQLSELKEIKQKLIDSLNIN